MPLEPQLQLGRRGGEVCGWEPSRREVNAEDSQALLGSLAGGVERAEGAAAATGAAEHVRAEGPLVKGGPVEARPGLGGGREGGEGELGWSGRRRWRMGDDRPQLGVGRVDAVEGRQVKSRRREESDESSDKVFCSDGEGGALLRGVLVPAVFEVFEPALGHRTTGTVARQSLEPLPSMLMVMPSRFSTPVKSGLVNCVP